MIFVELVVEPTHLKNINQFGSFLQGSGAKSSFLAAGKISSSHHLEDGLPGRFHGSVVNNHGDRFRPQDLGLWDPFQMALLWSWMIGSLPLPK